MRKLGLALLPALALVACNGSDSNTSAMNGNSQAAFCPVLNGTYEGPQVHDGNRVEDSSLTIFTRVEGASYYYRFDDANSTDFLANGPALQGQTDDGQSMSFSLACSSNRVQMTVQTGSAPAVTETFEVINENQLRISAPTDPEVNGIILTKR